MVSATKIAFRIFSEFRIVFLLRSVRSLNLVRETMPIIIDLLRFYQALLVFLKDCFSSKSTVISVIISCFILASLGLGHCINSTLPALLDMTKDWCFNIDRGMINGVLFLDLKKTFDTVDHKILLKKLEF